MRLFMVAGFAGLAVGIATVQPDALTNLYERIYPSDPGKRQALERCFMQDHQFNRLDGAARDACYEQLLRPGPAAAPADPPPSNFVDLWRSSGQGHLARGDIRAQQQSQRYLQRAP
jgi:hypothetical protein